MGDGTPLAIVAWHARNLLELAIWTEYCIQSPENGVRFGVDAVRDFDDIIKLISQDEIEANPEAKKHIQEFKAARSILATTITAEELSKRYTSVRTAASAIGKLTQYENTMKLLSKWAHPTAVAVMLGHPPGETITPVRIAIIKSAFKMAEEVCTMADGFCNEITRQVAQRGN